MDFLTIQRIRQTKAVMIIAKRSKYIIIPIPFAPDGTSVDVVMLFLLSVRF